MFLFSLRLSTNGIYDFGNFSQLKMKGTCKHMSHTCICSFPFFLKILAHTITNFIVILSCIYIMTLFLFVIFSLSFLIIFSKFHPSPLFLLHPRPTNLDSGYERKHDFASQYDSHDLQLHSVSCLLHIHSSLWLTRIHCTHPGFLYRSPFGRPQADCVSWLL